MDSSINDRTYLTIDKASVKTGLAKHFLREGIKSGLVPYIQAGNRYLINVPLLLSRLETISMNNCKT